ncbi:MAG TPA: hypothetical protein VG367_12685 [Mucilaginibacter sp.]|jgi:hypothetical protein|nr:hypothetical protein [Mucilaginibacter sp.]
MKSLTIVAIVLLWFNTSKKKNYISFEPFGNSDKSSPSTLVCKDSTYIEEFYNFDIIVVKDKYYNTLKDIVINSNPRNHIENDYRGNFKITVNEDGSEISYFLNRDLSNKLLKDLIKSLKKNGKQKKLEWEFEDILEHN